MNITNSINLNHIDDFSNYWQGFHFRYLHHFRGIADFFSHIVYSVKKLTMEFAALYFQIAGNMWENKPVLSANPLRSAS